MAGILAWLGGIAEALNIFKTARDLFQGGDEDLVVTAKLRGPAPRPRKVVGRDGDLDALHATLANRRSVAIATGQGGIGKTTLARLYVEKHGRAYDGILWARAQEVTTLTADLCLLPGEGDKEVRDLPPDAKARRMLDALPADQDWLIVYDNAPDKDALSTWWPNSARARVLVTSRSGLWPPEVGTVAPKTLPFASPGDAGPQLLMREASERKRSWSLEEKEEARALAEDLGGLPLALVAAGGLIRDEGGTFGAYRARLDAVLREKPKGDYPVSVIGAVALSYDALATPPDEMEAGERQKRLDARAVLDLFAWYSPEGLDAALLTDVPTAPSLGPAKEFLTHDLLALCADPERVAAATTVPVRRSLLARDRGTFALHRMTAAAVRALQVQAGRRDAAARQAAAVLAAAYPGGDESPAFSRNWPACSRLTPHVLSLHRAWPLAEGDRLESAAADYLFNQASIYLRRMAEHDPALALAEAALAQKRARLPEDHRDVAAGWSMLGAAYQEAGRLEDAVAAQAENVRLCEAHDHGAADTATAHNNHAAALRALGQARGDRALLAQAKAADETALALEREQCEEVSEDVASSLSNLATNHDALGETAVALDLSRQALAIRRKVLPPGDARLGFSLIGTGAYHLRLGRANAARPLLAEALEVFREAYRRDKGRDHHPLVTETASWLVVCHLVLARRDPDHEAEARRFAADFGLDWRDEQRIAAQYPGPVDMEAGAAEDGAA